jgi:hypothetical protein
MKNLIITFIALVGSLNLSNAQTDFRGFSWGSTPKQVELGEKNLLIKKIPNEELIYKDILGGSNCSVVFIFNDNNKLESGMYIFSKKYRNPQLYVQDFSKFKKLLIEKYGISLSEKENWAFNTPNDEKSNYGQAVADGHLQLSSVWHTDRSVIKISLLTVDKRPNVQIHYTARSLDDLEDKDALKAAVKKL